MGCISFKDIYLPCLFKWVELNVLTIDILFAMQELLAVHFYIYIKDAVVVRDTDITVQTDTHSTYSFYIRYIFGTHTCIHMYMWVGNKQFYH